MDRAEYIKWLRLDAMSIEGVEAFFRGLPERVPPGHSDDAEAAQTSVKHHLADLNATMLGRVADHRVSVDIEAMCEQVADRMKRYGSTDWSRDVDGRDLLTYTKATVGEISADLREAQPPDDDPLDGDDD